MPSDSPFPPHVGFDASPLDCPREWFASHAARRLRLAGSKLREISPLHEEWNCRRVKERGRLETECGELAIQAWGRQLLPKIAELSELIEWYTTPIPSPRVHCPSNLFGDLCGGDTFQGKLENGIPITDANGRVVLETDHHGRAKSGGGLLPRYFPELLKLPVNERSAAVCEWLADRIEEAARSDSDDSTGLHTQRDLMRLLQIPPKRFSAVRACLDRWRQEHREESGRGWIEVQDRGPRQPKHLYCLTAVRALLSKYIS